MGIENIGQKERSDWIVIFLNIKSALFSDLWQNFLCVVCGSDGIIELSKQVVDASDCHSKTRRK